jgi:hypothetical protein
VSSVASAVGGLSAIAEDGKTKSRPFACRLPCCLRDSCTAETKEVIPHNEYRINNSLYFLQSPPDKLKDRCVALPSSHRLQAHLVRRPPGVCVRYRELALRFNDSSNAHIEIFSASYCVRAPLLESCSFDR